MADFFGPTRCASCDTVHADTDICSAESLERFNNQLTHAFLSATAEGIDKAIVGPQDFDAALKLVVDEVYDLVLSKQHDYGHDNIVRHGLKGLCVRIADKQARLHHAICDNNGPPTNESLRDTFMDIVGYGLLGLMVLDGTFELPLSNDK